MDNANEISNRRTETGKFYELDHRLGNGKFGQEVSTGPIHYKDRYKDWDPWLDIDHTYSKKGVAANGEPCLVYPKMPNIVRVFKNTLGYEIQSRSNPDHLARVELVSLDGTNARSIPFGHGAKARTDVGTGGVRLWKDLSEIWTPGNHTVRWKVAEFGSPGKDSHPFVFREVPEAYSVADPNVFSLDEREKAKVTIETARTRIDDQSWYWDEIIPAGAKLVDTDWQVANTANDGFWTDGGGGVFYGSEAYIRICGSSFHGFTRFPSVAIPPGSTILSAYVTVWAYDQDGNPIIWMCLNDADSAVAPTDYAEALALAQTTEGSAWSTTAWTFRNPYQTSSIVTAVQEVIDRAGWASGNALMPLYIDTGYATWKAFLDYSSGIPAEAPKLTVTWNEPWNHTKHYAGVKHMAARQGVW